MVCQFFYDVPRGNFTTKKGRRMQYPNALFFPQPELEVVVLVVVVLVVVVFLVVIVVVLIVVLVIVLIVVRAVAELKVILIVVLIVIVVSHFEIPPEILFFLTRPF